MSSINRVLLLGNLGKDPDVKTIDSGKSVANFSIATTETWKNAKGEKVQDTTWHNIVLWGKPAEIAQKYLHKGDQVFIEGKIKTRSYEKDGVTKYITEVVGDNITLLGGGKKSEETADAEEFKFPF